MAGFAGQQMHGGSATGVHLKLLPLLGVLALPVPAERHPPGLAANDHSSQASRQQLDLQQRSVGAEGCRGSSSRMLAS